MTEKYVCTLPRELKDCECRKEDGTCMANTAGCGFREKEAKSSPAAKPKKWYEEYIRK